MKRAVLLAMLLAAGPAAAQAGPVSAVHLPASVDSLLEQDLLQEAAWTARVLGDTARADAILARLDSILRSRPVSAKPLDVATQGVSYTFRLQYPGGVSAIFKVDGSDLFCPSCGAEREVAAYRIDRLLGFDLTPMTILRTIVTDGDTLAGSAMYFVRGARRPAELGAEKPDRLRFMDALLGNSDRHAANWLVLQDGSIVAIDHNRAFEYRPTTRPKTCWETEVDSIIDPAGLGAPLERYRRLPADSLAAAVAGLLTPEQVESFVAMRDRVVARIERRIAQPARSLPREDCPWQD